MSNEHGEPLIHPRIFSEIRGRMVFGRQDLQAKIDEKAMPRPPEFAWPKSSYDEIASEFGLMGFEYHAIIKAADAKLTQDGPLKEAYLKFLRIAIISCPDAISDVRAFEEKQAIRRQMGDHEYYSRLKAYEHRKNQLTYNWNKNRQVVRAHWDDLAENIPKILESKSDIRSMDVQDSKFFRMLSRKGFLKIKKYQIVDFDVEKFKAITVEEAHDIVLKLLSKKT